LKNVNLFSPVERGNPLPENRKIPGQSPDRMQELWSVKSIWYICWDERARVNYWSQTKG